MKTELIVENWRRFLHEEELNLAYEYGITEPYNEKGDHVAFAGILRKIFKYFHLASFKLGEEDFTVNPRVPRGPMSGEDDFTERVSLAPSIERAIKSLELGGDSMIGYYVYAGDFLDIPDDDIPVFHTKKQIPKCPSYEEDDEEIKYGSPRWSWKKWLHYNFKDAKGKDLAKSIEARKYNSVDFLPKKFRQQFYGCVPDAKKTDEKWALQDIKLYHLGKMIDDRRVLVAPHGIEVINRYLKYLDDEGID